MALKTGELTVGGEAELEKLKKAIKHHADKIDFYENPFLKELYSKNKGKTHEYVTRDGKKTKLVINDITDVYTVIIHSFKPTK